MLAVHNNSGTILRERYRVTNIVGHGGMGHVYRAEDLRLPGRLCAVKSVPHDSTTTPEIQAQAQQQFLKEASILAQLDHPNLPKVSDFFTEDDHDYLVMDFVPGMDLRQVLEETRAEGRLLEQDVVLKWAEQIIDALAYLHRQDPPVLHRDIKPSNIKLTPDSRIKLVDFGLVKLLAPDDVRTVTVLQGRGTLQYTPLEQYGGQDSHTDARTDIYALGATLYYLLTDYPPPDAKARFLNPNILKPPHQINGRISRKVSEAIMWAMEMHPDDRPSDVSQFREVLLGQLSRPSARSEESSASDFSNALRAHWVPALIALVLFVLAVALTVL